MLSRKLICSFIHQKFIENPLLAKILHFQTYSLDLLPITVNYIDSIHICMDFMLELLSQPQLNKQVFAVHLASYLCEKFPLHRCIDIALASIARVKQMGKLTGSFTLKSVDASSHLATQNMSATQATTASKQQQEGTVLTKSTREEYEKAILVLLDTFTRFATAFPFLSIECVQCLDELKCNFPSHQALRQKILQIFTQLSSQMIDNAKK